MVFPKLSIDQLCCSRAVGCMN